MTNEKSLREDQLSTDDKKTFLRKLITKVRHDFYQTKNVTDMNEWIVEELGVFLENETR